MSSLLSIWQTCGGNPTNPPRIGKLDLGLEIVPPVAGAAEHARALDVLARRSKRVSAEGDQCVSRMSSAGTCSAVAASACGLRPVPGW